MMLYNPIPGMYQIYHNPAAGLISSVADLAKFDLALDAGLLLGDAAKTEMFAPAISTYKNRTDLNYGLGWYVQNFEGLRILWHTGRSNPSTSALDLKIPEEDLTFIVLANTDNLTVPFNSIGSGDVPVFAGLELFLPFYLPCHVWHRSAGHRLDHNRRAINEPAFERGRCISLDATWRGSFGLTGRPLPVLGRPDRVNVLWRVS